MTYPMSDRDREIQEEPLAAGWEARGELRRPGAARGFPPARPLVRAGEQDGLPRRTVAVVRHDFIPDGNVRRRKMASGPEAC
jgi:hypothetical protein